MVYLTSEVFYAYMYWFEEEEEKSSMVPLTCLSTFVNMYNVEWLPQKMMPLLQLMSATN